MRSVSSRPGPDGSMAGQDKACWVLCVQIFWRQGVLGVLRRGEQVRRGLVLVCWGRGDVRSVACERISQAKLAWKHRLSTWRSAFFSLPTYNFAHDCWWCEHVCECVCGMLRIFCGSRLTATFIKRECG